MPIPSLTSSLKPRNHIGKANKTSKIKDAPSTTEPSRNTTPSNDPGSTLSSNPSSSRLSQPSSIPNHSNVDGMKRRSFLPQRGLPQHSSRTNKLGEVLTEMTEAELITPQDSTSSQTTSSNAQASQPTSMQGPTQARVRPRSMYQTSSVRTEQPVEKKPPMRSMRTPDVVSGNTSSVPQLSGLNRSQSLRKPEASTHPAQISTTRAHTRTQSTNTTTAARKGASEPKTNSERPRSVLAEPSRTAKPASNVAPDNTSSGIRSSIRLAALKRSTGTRVKPEAAQTSEVIGSVVKADEALTTSLRRREPLSEEPKKQGRPAFSTLQQHFTPRKNGKAPTSAFLHPPASEVGAGSLSIEIVSLQSELLQLHLLHASTTKTNRQWELSAQKSLRRKFDEVASLYQVMQENERQGQEQKNIQALREWNSGSSTFALVEHIQILSGPLHELPSLMDSGGRFMRLVDESERWTSKVVEIWAAREDDMNGRGGDQGHIEGLGDSWKAENAALMRKLTTFSRDLNRITQPASGSSIASIVATCKVLLEGILNELHVMRTIEASVVAREQEWVEIRLQAIARGAGEHLVDTHEGNEAWRM